MQNNVSATQLCELVYLKYFEAAKVHMVSHNTKTHCFLIFCCIS